MSNSDDFYVIFIATLLAFHFFRSWRTTVSRATVRRRMFRKKNRMFFSLKITSDRGSLGDLRIFVLGRRRSCLESRWLERESTTTGDRRRTEEARLGCSKRYLFTRRALARVMERNVRRVTNVWVIDSMTLWNTWHADPGARERGKRNNIPIYGSQICNIWINNSRDSSSFRYDSALTSDDDSHSAFWMHR